MTVTRAARIFLKPAVFAASSWPAVAFARDVWLSRLGPHPYRRLIVDSGDWALWFLLFTLMLTPARRVTGWHWLNLFRRMLGLFAFFYAVVHASAYVAFEPLAIVQLEPGRSAWATASGLVALIGGEIADKPFIALGIVALAALMPLAATSSAAMIRRLGGRRWRRLHRLIFVAVGAGVLHHWWPLPDRFHADAFGAALAIVAIARLAWWWQRGSRARPAGAVQRT